jgi:hypothetical protein
MFATADQLLGFPVGVTKTRPTGKARLLVASPALSQQLGVNICDEVDLLPLLLAHGIIRRVFESAESLKNKPSVHTPLFQKPIQEEKTAATEPSKGLGALCMAMSAAREATSAQETSFYPHQVIIPPPHPPGKTATPLAVAMRGAKPTNTKEFRPPQQFSMVLLPSAPAGGANIALKPPPVPSIKVATPTPGTGLTISAGGFTVTSQPQNQKPAPLHGQWASESGSFTAVYAKHQQQSLPYPHKKITDKDVTLEMLQAHFHLSLTDASRVFHICITRLKKICRRHGIKRWPCRQIQCALKLEKRTAEELNNLTISQRAQFNMALLPSIARGLYASAVQRLEAMGEYVMDAQGLATESPRVPVPASPAPPPLPPPSGFPKFAV